MDRNGSRARIGGSAVLVALLLAAGLTVAGAAPASAAPLPAVGVQFQAMWSQYSDAERVEVLDRLAEAGLQWVRIDMGWSSFQEGCRTCYSEWYIEQADFAVDAARARGLNVLVMLWRTPGWANGGRDVYTPPTDPEDYGTIAGWVADHFRGRVAAYEIWNEPNQDDFFKGTAAQYTAMLESAYPAIKAADPSALVVLGGPAYNDTGWLAQVYDHGGQGSFDVLSTHPYQAPADLPPETPDTSGEDIWLLDHVGAVRDLMADEGDGDKPIWFTEFGWSAHANWSDIQPWDLGVTAEEQADYLVRAVEFVAAEHPYVTNMFWYNERNTDLGHPRLDNYGLLDGDLQPKPVYDAVKGLVTGDGGGGSDGGESPPAGGCTIVGTPGPDVLVGTAGRDVICGGGGDDSIFGAGGDDELRGGPGKDLIMGGAGADTLKGGAGADVLNGGPGNDLAYGQAGGDSVAGGGGADGLFGGLGVDSLTVADGVHGNDGATGGPGVDACRADPGDRLTTC